MTKANTQTQNTEPDWDVEDSEYLYLGDGDKVMLEMLDEGIGAVDKYHNDVVDFEVLDVSNSVKCFWRVTSARVKRVMKRARPITGKIFEISRAGEGYETRYTIIETPEIDQFVGE